MKLSVHDHDRTSAGMKYVYPVVSRRSGGVSVGINLNPNNACNFRCVYCQVPDLIAGNAPHIDLDLLRDEVGELLETGLSAQSFAEDVGPEFRRLRDVAISGNGEPTSSPQLMAVIEILGEELRRRDLLGTVPLVLITNGSHMLKGNVGAAVARLADLGGAVWFKMDSATTQGIKRINNSAIDAQGQWVRLVRSTELCRTLVQVCLFRSDDKPPSDSEQSALIERFTMIVRNKIAVDGVFLYGLARPSQQPEAGSLSPLTAEWMEEFAGRIRALGIEVHVTA